MMFWEAERHCYFFVAQHSKAIYTKTIYFTASFHMLSQ